MAEDARHSVHLHSQMLLEARIERLEQRLGQRLDELEGALRGDLRSTGLVGRIEVVDAEVRRVAANLELALGRADDLDTARTAMSSAIEGLQAVGVAFAAHHLEHYGDDNQPPRWRTASSWTLLQAYPVRWAMMGLFVLGLCIYEIRVWAWEHAAFIWKLWWKAR